MRSDEHGTRRDEDGVEVVAAEGDDGSFELRVTRTSGVNRSITPVDSAAVKARAVAPDSATAVPTSGTRAQRRSGSKPSAGAVVVAVVALVGLVVAGIVSTRQAEPAGSSGEPAAVVPAEPSDDAGFRVFYLENPIEQPIRTLELDLDGGIDLGVPERRAETDAGTATPRVAGPQARPDDLPAIGEAATGGPDGQVLEARDEVRVRHLDELTIERLREVQVEVPIDPTNLVRPVDEWPDEDGDPEFDDE